MLLQSDLNKWRLSLLAKLDKLYVNSASKRLLKIFQNYFIEYKNHIFPNNLHIHLIDRNAESLYNLPSSVTGSNIYKIGFYFELLL